MKKIIFLFIILLFALTTMRVNGQDTCSRAIRIDSIFSSLKKDTTISITSSNVCWTKFTANSNTKNLNFYRGDSNTVTITTISIYHGVCNTLILDSTYTCNDTTFSINLNNLSSGTSYYVQINFSNTFIGKISVLSISYVTSCAGVDGCGYLKNPFFDYVLDMQQSASGYKAFQLDAVCKWKRALGEPCLRWESFTQQFYADLLVSNYKTQAIYQNFQSPTYLPSGDYTFSMKYYTGSNIGKINALLTNYTFPAPISGLANDNIPIGLNENDINNGVQNLKISNTFSTSVTPSSCGYNTQNYAQYYEFFNVPNGITYNNLIIYPEQTNSSNQGRLYIGDIIITPRITFQGSNPIYVCSQTPSTITITANVPSEFAGNPSFVTWLWRNTSGPCTPCANQQCGTGGSGQNSYTIPTPTSTTTYYVEASYYDCRYYGSITIVVNSSIQPLSINGALDDNCHKHGNFNIVNPQPGIIYTWTVPSGASFTPSGAGTNKSIYWGTAIVGNITVQGKNSSGCLIYEGYLTIDPTNLPDPTTINVPINVNSVNCDPELKVQFSFVTPTNPTPPSGLVWTWILPGNATYVCNPTCPNDILATWNNAGKDYIKLQGVDPANGCLDYEGLLLFDPNPNCNINVSLIADKYTNSNPTNTSSLFMNFYGTGTLVTANTIYIDGVFTVDEDIMFVDCDNIKMGPNAKIFVNPGKYIQFSNSKVYACSCPWDGIYVEDPTATVLINNKSIIQDAANAVVSINNGNFVITDNSEFINNKIGVWVKDYYSITSNPPIPHQGFISNTTFKYDINYQGPYNYNNYITGVKVDNVYQLTIGDNSDPILKNKFINMQYGIKIYNSDVNIYNNYFENIGVYSIDPPSYTGTSFPIAGEAAIYVEKDPGAAYGQNLYLHFTNEINIGGSGFNLNVFNLCNIGIYGTNIKPKIEYNNFKNQIYTAIHLIDCRDGLNVENNYINMNNVFSNYASQLKNLYNSSIIINFYNASSSNPIQILNNSIDEPRVGINMTNCVGNSVGDCKVNGNTLNFYTVFSSYNNYIGIKTGSGDKEYFENNNINYNITPTSGLANALRGFYIDGVNNTLFIGNNMKNLGSGMNVAGVSQATEFWCNYFETCWFGINFSNAVISHQYYYPKLYPEWGTDNQWIDISVFNADYRLTGTIAPSINWYQFPPVTTSHIFSPYITPWNSLYGLITPLSSTVAHGCFSNKKSMQQQIDRASLLEKIVLDSIVYPNLPVENKYYSKVFAYKFLDNDSTYLNLGLPDDSIYLNFYNFVKLSNIGKFIKIDKYLKNKDYNNANTLNTSIIGVNLMETNQIEVNRIYLKKLMLNSISIMDSIALADIANQKPSTGGKGVYGARVILGLDPYDESLPQNFLPPDYNSKTINTSDIKVYPNPANDELYIVFKNVNEGVAKVEFYDLTGKLFYSTSITASLEVSILNISSFKAGIYNIRIITNNKTENQKIVIIK